MGCHFLLQGNLPNPGIKPRFPTLQADSLPAEPQGKPRNTGKKERKKVRLLSCVQLFGTPWTVACQAPPSVEFSKQEYWSELPFPSPGDLPDPRMKPWSSALQADALPSEPPRGTLRVLEWVAYPFSSRSSQSRDQTQVSHIAGRFFTSRATREALITWETLLNKK